MHKWMEDYLEQVRGQIRWKQARTVVLKELQDHILDEYEACLLEGMAVEAAEEEALRQMGDPVPVGKELDQVHRPRYAWELIGAVAVLLSVSLLLCVRVFYGSGSMWSLNHWLWTPMLAMGLGAVCCFFLSRLDMNAFASKSHRLYPAAVAAMLLLVLLQKRCVQGILYWGHYAGMFLPLVYGAAVYGLRGRGARGLGMSALLLLPLLGLNLLSGSMWTFVSLAVSAPVILLCANRFGSFGEQKKRNAVCILSGTLAMIAAVLIAAKDRIAAMMNPITMGLSENFMRQYLLGLQAHSRPVGQGEAFALTEGLLITPDNLHIDSVFSTDFLLAAVSYLCGWTAALAILAALVVFLALLLRRGLRQSTLWGKLLAWAVIVPLLVQTAGYVLANAGLPLSSFELPFLSYGGAYKVVDLSLLGILLGVIRSRSILRDAGDASRVHLA